MPGGLVRHKLMKYNREKFEGKCCTPLQHVAFVPIAVHNMYVSTVVAAQQYLLTFSLSHINSPAQSF